MDLYEEIAIILLKPKKSTLDYPPKYEWEDGLAPGLNIPPFKHISVVEGMILYKQ